MKRINREARLRWIPINEIKINPVAQRELRDGWADHIAVNLDIEKLGTPVVNHRDGVYYCVDGQHRIEGLKRAGWVDQQVQCETYENLTEAEEAELFLDLNNRIAVDAFSKFVVGVRAGRAVECEIDRVVRANGLSISKTDVEGGIRAVGKLRNVYARSDSETLGRTLRIIRDAYGTPGLEALVIDGIGHLCARYNGELDEKRAIEKLANLRGGVNGLLGRAETIHRATGKIKSHCVAAAAVDVINSGKGGKKLPNWWWSVA